VSNHRRVDLETFTKVSFVLIPTNTASVTNKRYHGCAAQTCTGKTAGTGIICAG